MQRNEIQAAEHRALINCDDLGYGDLGCYGSTVNDTPEIDRMASEGCVSQTSTWRRQSARLRGAMLTGCYPPRIGFGEFEGRGVLFPGQPVGLSPDEITIASPLQRAGYATSSSASGTAAISLSSCRRGMVLTATTVCRTATTWQAARIGYASAAASP